MNTFWSNNPWDWGTFKLPPVFDDTMFEERKKGMTIDQEKLLEKMPDHKLLIELAIAFANTWDYKLDTDQRKSIMTVFDALNLDHLSDYPCNTKEGSGS